MKAQEEILAKEISINLRIIDLMVICGNMQLGLRHPENVNISARMGKKILALFLGTLIQQGVDFPPEVIAEYEKDIGPIPKVVQFEIFDGRR